MKFEDELIWIGPWADDDHPERPRPEDHVDPTTTDQDRSIVACYLDNGFLVGAPLDGYATCSLCSDDMYRGTIRTDGTYIWRSGVSHYVKEHGVRLPDQFLDHVWNMLDEIDNGGGDDNMAWWDSNPYGMSPDHSSSASEICS